MVTYQSYTDDADMLDIYYTIFNVYTGPPIINSLAATLQQ